MDRVIRQIVPAIALGALLARVATTALAPLANADTYFHLRLGNEFLHGWQPWHPAHLSPSATAEWLPTQWASQVVMALVERLGGLGALSTLYAALLVLLVVTWYRTARRRSDPLVATLITSMAVIAAGDGLSLRPQVVSYLLMTVVVLTWSRAIERRTVPWLLIPLSWLWAMLHGMWVLGAGASLVLALAAVVEGRLPRRCLAVPAGMLAVAAVTPAGPGLIGAVLEVNSRAAYFTEWAAPSFTSIHTLAATGLLGLCIIAFLRGRGASLYEAAWVLTGLALLVYSTRTVPMAAAALLPLAAAQAQRVSSGTPVTTPSTRSLRALTAAGLAAVAVVGAVNIASPRQPPQFAHALDSTPSGATVLTDSRTGGILLWARPDLDIPIHGYGDLYTDAELSAYHDLFGLRGDWHQALKAIAPDAALLPRAEPLTGALRGSGWTSADTVDDLVLLLPPDEADER